MFIVLRFGFLLFVLFGYGVHALSEHTHRRFTAVQSRVEAQCRAFRKMPGHETTTVCAVDLFAPNSVAEFKAANGHLEDAQKLLDRGDRAAARAHAESALEIAAHLDSRRLLIGTMLSAKIVNDVLDLAESHPAEIEARSLVAHARVWSADHPLEAVRLNRLYELSQQAERSALPAPLIELLIAEWIDREDVKLTEMQLALLSVDRARCERAANSPIDSLLCAKMSDVVRAGRRVEALQNGAVPRR